MGNEKLSIDDLDSGVSLIKNKGMPDELDILEKSDVNDQKIQEEVKRLRSDRILREKYADKIINFLYFYGGVVSILVFIHGFSGIFGFPFKLLDQVLVTLVGSTAAAAIGLVGFVASGLFGNTRK